MSNRETYPSQLFPLRGDVSAEAGDVVVTVTGLRTVPISTIVPVASQSLVTVDGLTWSARSLDNAILVNGLPKSDDYNIGVNVILGTTVSPVLINGV